MKIKENWFWDYIKIEKKETNLKIKEIKSKFKSAMFFLGGWEFHETFENNLMLAVTFNAFHYLDSR